MSLTRSCSIGVMAFNEEGNIRYLLEALLNQRLATVRIEEIVVVASGCTDRTEKIVEALARSNALIKLAVQDERQGKASAINFFLSSAKAEIAVIESGDTIPAPEAIENLIRPFSDPGVGMTGAHPLPVNSAETFMGFTAHLFWRLHHQMALQHPKLGELIAFRNIVPQIPADTAVDEASIEAIITRAGYTMAYAQDALVYNKGPETVGDFLKQRRRIMIGHKHLQRTRGYTVATMKLGNLSGLVSHLFGPRPRRFRTIVWTLGAVCLEFFGRFLGDVDYYLKKKNPFAWDVAASTKKLKHDPPHSSNPGL